MRSKEVDIKKVDVKKTARANQSSVHSPIKDAVSSLQIMWTDMHILCNYTYTYVPCISYTGGLSVGVSE